MNGFVPEIIYHVEIATGNDFVFVQQTTFKCTPTYEIENVWPTKSIWNKQITGFFDTIPPLLVYKSLLSSEYRIIIINYYY